MKSTICILWMTLGRLFSDFIVAGLTTANGASHLSPPPKGSSAPLVPNMLYHLRSDEDASAIVEFCFPEVDDTASPSESFTFTLTKDDSTRIFGFCRRLMHDSNRELPICLCVLSQRPWFSLFMHLLDIVQLNYDLGRFVPAFINAAYDTPLPPAGTGASLCIEPLVRGESFYGTFRLSLPMDDRPTGMPFGPILEALGVANMLRVLSALMTEQHVIFVGSRWGASLWLRACRRPYSSTRCSGSTSSSRCCPSRSCRTRVPPMPFVLGILSRHLPALKAEPLDQVLFVDVDSGKLWGDAQVLEAAQLPTPHREALHQTLSRLLKAARSSQLDNAAVAEGSPCLHESPPRSVPQVCARRLKPALQARLQASPGLQTSPTNQPFKPAYKPALAYNQPALQASPWSSWHVSFGALAPRSTLCTTPLLSSLLCTAVHLIAALSHRRFVRPGPAGASAACMHPDFDDEAFICDAPASVQPLSARDALFTALRSLHTPADLPEPRSAPHQHLRACSRPAHKGGRGRWWPRS